MNLLQSLSLQQIAVIRSMGGLVFDAVFEETHESDLEVTDNPVETGVVVSDHAYMKPLRVKISAGVSDVRLNPFASDPFDSVVSRSQRAFELLTELQKKAEPFDLQTGLKLYKNMVCTSIRTSQDKDSSAALLFTAELREVITVNTEIVQYNTEPGATAMQAKPIRESGEQQIKEETRNRQSLLYSMTKIEKGAK